jgi:predicted O-methyltransferase YrrM
MTNTILPVATQIEEAVKNIPGWSPIDQLLTLFTLAYASANVPGDILELGSWCGRSAVALGMAARLTGDTKVHCIDLFPEKSDWYRNEDGTYSFSVTINGKAFGANLDQTVWAEPYLRDIAPVYEQFNGTLEAFNHNIAERGLTDRVKPYRTNLQSFATSAPDDLRLRFAFIDGDHSYDAICGDIAAVEKFLLPGGWICFDDAFSSYDGVNQAIRMHIIDSGKYCRFQQMTRKCFVAQRK